jgi:hypothetical protein
VQMLSVLMFLAFCVSVGFGAASDPAAMSPPIAIMKHTWYLDSGLMREISSAASDPSIQWPTSSIPGVLNPANPRQNPRRAMVVPPPIGEPVERPKTRDVFRYEVTVRNQSTKPIKRVFWSYDFLNPDTSAVVARHRFATDTKIKPGKSKRIEGLTYLPPSNVSSVRVLKREPGWEKSERVVIFQIQFEDGTFWSRRRSAQPIP